MKKNTRVKEVVGFQNYLSSWLFEMAEKTHRKGWNKEIMGISWALPWFRLVSFQQKWIMFYFPECWEVGRWWNSIPPETKKYPLLSNIKARLEDYRIFEVTKRFKIYQNVSLTFHWHPGKIIRHRSLKYLFYCHTSFCITCVSPISLQTGHEKMDQPCSNDSTYDFKH